MKTIEKDGDDEILACKMCLQEIPISEIKNEEARDYVIHYYGVDCYALWAKQRSDQSTEQ